MAMDGWDIEPGSTVDTETGEVFDAPADRDHPPLSMDVNDLVAAITASPDALAVLTEAINGPAEREQYALYATAAEFVELWFIRRFPRHLDHVQWCDHWWKHPEGRMILEWMWEDWEEQRKRAGSLFGWFVHTCKPAVDYLNDAHGPFEGCKHTIRNPDGTIRQKGQHNETRQRLPVGLAPDELFIPVPTKANPNP